MPSGTFFQLPDVKVNFTDPCTSSAIAELNGRIAKFYLSAASRDPLEAITDVLREMVPGVIHLAFVSGGAGEVGLSRDIRSHDRDFLMDTMGAAASHPLIYRTKGKLAAISDVISAADWERRDMYQVAKPFLKMEDSLGTDTCIAPGMVFSTCVIRESRSFQPGDRMLFNLMLPHFLTALRISGNQMERGDSFRVFSLEEFPRGAQALSRMLAEWLGARNSIPENECDLLAERCGEWIRHRLRWRSDDRGSAHLHSSLISAGQVACSLRFIPASKYQTGALVVHAKSSGGGIPHGISSFPLTPREREVGRWLCDGKTNSEIALILGIKPGTVKRHLENIYGKLGVPNRASATRLILGL